MNFTAKAKFIKIAPDKIRVLSSMIKSQKTGWVLSQLEFAGIAGAKPLINALRQAIDQAKSKNLNPEDFKILTTKVDEGPKLKRRRILHQGRSTMILKRMSHVTVVITDEDKFTSPKGGTVIKATEGSK